MFLILLYLNSIFLYNIEYLYFNFKGEIHLRDIMSTIMLRIKRVCVCFLLASSYVGAQVLTIIYFHLYKIKLKEH